MKNRIYTLFTVFLFFFSITICTVQSVTKTIAQEQIGKAIVFRINDVINQYYDEDVDTLVLLQNRLLKQKSLESLTEKYVQYALHTVIFGIDSTEIRVDKPLKDIEDESLKIIHRMIGNSREGFSEGVKEAIEEGNQAIISYTIAIVENASSHKMLAVLYSLISSTMYKIFYLIVSILLLWFTFKIDDLFTWIDKIRNRLLICAPFVLTTGVLLRSIGMKLSNLYLGRTILFEVTPFNKYTVVLVSVSVILFVAEYVWKEKCLSRR